jgi:hypothetical protein
MLNTKLTILLLTSLLLTANLAQAKSNSMDKNLENKLINICKALKSDDKIKLRHSIKESGLRERVVFRGLVCNGMSPLAYALSENANLTAHYIGNKSGVKYIAALQQSTPSKSDQTPSYE